MGFDRSFLDDAEVEFVVLADTHHMLDQANRNVEFGSRLQQTARSDLALRLVATLDASFTVHLGDLVQEFPDTVHFDQALDEALGQFQQHDLQPKWVAGNHDVGDKPDPTMPTSPVTPESLAAHHDRLGASWYSWNEAGCHFVVLNSQIMNSDLPEADRQRQWLEADLAAHHGERVFLFLHLAPFLYQEDELSLGHYDNIGQPDRAWLLRLLRKHNVEMLFAGHSHFAFVNGIGGTLAFVVPSVSFTRPGFGEMFSSCPPPERGRDDTAKLGFYLVRVHRDGSSVHVVRTSGETAADDSSSSAARLITGTSCDLPRSPLGVVSRHPLSQKIEVPIAWPSVTRQPVRNDYPLLSCLELGVRHIRVPVTDLDNAEQSERLGLLRAQGVAVTATLLWPEQLDLGTRLLRTGSRPDCLELQIPGTRWPGESCLRDIQQLQREHQVPIALSTIIPGERVGGKQHPRTRIGYRVTELSALDRHLSEYGIRVDRVLCRIDAADHPWEPLLDARELQLTHVGAVDWIVELPAEDDGIHVARAAETLFAATLLPDARVFLEPFIDLDRTMDTSFGLLDRLCNPRPAFQVLRNLNTILFGAPEAWRPGPVWNAGGARVAGLLGESRNLWLLLPVNGRDEKPVLDLRDLPGFPESGSDVGCSCLERGTSQSLPAGTETFAVDEATLLRIPVRNQQ